MADSLLNPKKGEIWIVPLDPTKGSEMKKTRPVVVVNEELEGNLPLRIIVPITGWQNRFELLPWLIRISPNEKNGLSKESGANTFQVRSISVGRFRKKIGMVNTTQLKEIVAGIVLCLGYEENEEATELEAGSLLGENLE